MPQPLLTLRHCAGATDLLELRLDELEERIQDRFVITDSNLLHHYCPILAKAQATIVVPAGEQSKSWGQAGQILEELAAKGAVRGSSFLAFGGGVVGDLGGFCASAYMRGIELIQTPTSLLAMVDSSVGGKVGVDLAAGKNLAGSFWPGTEVWFCYETLSTLPNEEWRNGAAEIWKYGFISAPELLNDLTLVPISPTHPRIEEIIRQCARIKADVVQQDERDISGLRATLNFGHTLGHAVEAEMNYQGISHGEAVAIGMVWETKLAERLGLAEAHLSKRITDAMLLQGLPTQIPGHLDRLELLKWMRRDKKAVKDGLSFSLVTEYGKCKLVEGVPDAEVRALLTET